MKSDKQVYEQVGEENQTQEGRAKKGTSNAKNYTSRCTGLGLHKMFVALPEEEKGALCATCFAPLLLIDPIATMSTLVVEIFDRHLGDMKFQFWETIIQMKPIHVCLILGLRVSPIANEFLFVDPEYMKNFRRRRFPKKKNTYGRCSSIKFVKNYTILSPPEQGEKRLAIKPSETDMQQDLVQGAMRYQIKTPVIGAIPIIGVPAVSAPTVVVPAMGTSSSTTEIEAVVVRVCSQLEEHGKILLKLDDHGKMLHTHGKILERISMSTMGGSIYHLKIRHSLCSTSSLLMRKLQNASEEKGEEKDNDDKKDVEGKVKSEEEEVQEMEESKNGDKKVGDVAEEEDSEQPTVVVYYTGKKDVQSDNKTMVAAVVAKTDIVFFNQEEVVGEAYQTKESKNEVEHNKDELFEGNDDDDGNSQNKPGLVQVIRQMAIDQTNA
ncbi:hypothetical protein GIB67_021922 [Kingdonia uniflora]|uniref:Uncharacterized protein n=1 Tax=Kingdonia uniflora TaxID=39325 RepID=A0A7J7N458_9MAGN|nr:hypothetical protein GIB67_021922 [Kingdonia uniflora]